MKRTSALILTAAMVFTLASWWRAEEAGNHRGSLSLDLLYAYPRRHANWESIPGYV